MGEYILSNKEVEDIKSSLKAHINQCERFLDNGGLTIDEAEKVINKVTRMKDLQELFTNQ